MKDKSTEEKAEERFWQITDLYIVKPGYQE